MLGVQLNQYGRFQPYTQSFAGGYPATQSVSEARGLKHTFGAVTPLHRIQQVINHRVADSIDAISRPQPIGVQDSSAFDAQEVADNVLGMIQNRLGQAQGEGADAQQLQALREQARSGIAQGTQEARDVLQGLGMLSSSVEEDIAQVEKLLNAGLDAGTGDSGQAQAADRLAIDQQFQNQAESSFELEIMTRDGDQVTLKFHQASSEQGFVSYRQTTDAEVLTAGRSASSEQHFELSVQGELDAEELTAITDFTHQVGQLSDSFFNGNLQTVLEQGTQLGFDTRQIAGFALEMEYSQSSVATARYQEMSSLGQNDRPQLAGLEQVRGLLNQIKGVIGQAQGLFEEPKQATSDLLTEFVSRHPRAEAFARTIKGEGGDELEDMVGGLVGEVSDAPADQDD